MIDTTERKSMKQNELPGVMPETKMLFAMSSGLKSTRLDRSEAIKSRISGGIAFPQGSVKRSVQLNLPEGNLDGLKTKGHGTSICHAVWGITV